MVNVRGNLYAASLLDLPCIIEGMKSWDKKQWFKSADICQMLLVLGRVKNEEEAKKFPLPREIDQVNWQYPHGLTPPMHWVRKRRFRKRVNIKTIERVEADVEELLKKDKEFKDDAGMVTYEWVDPEAEFPEGDMTDGYYDGDVQYGDGEENDGDDMNPEADADAEVDPNAYVEDEDEADDEFAKMMEEALAAGEVEEDAVETTGETPIDTAVETLGRGLLHASPDGLVPPEAALTPASGGTTSVTEGDSQDEGGSDEDEDDGDDEDEEAKAERQERQQQLEEIEDLKQEIAQAEARKAKQTNGLLRQKITREIQAMEADLQLKRASLGMNGEED